MTSCTADNEQQQEKYSPVPTYAVTEKPINEIQVNNTYTQEENTEISYIGNKKSKKIPSP